MGRWSDAEDECQKDLTHAIARAEKAEDDYQDLFEEFGVQNAELAKHVVMMDEALDALESTEKAGKEK